MCCTHMAPRVCSFDGCATTAVDVFVPSTTRYTETWGVVFPHMWGLMWGYIWGIWARMSGRQKPCQDMLVVLGISSRATWRRTWTRLLCVVRSNRAQLHA